MNEYRKQLKRWLHESPLCKWPALSLITACALLAFASPSRAASPGKELPDTDVTAAIEQGLILEKGVFPNDVDVTTNQGIATLSGAVDNILAKERAVRIAESIRGVRGVIDRISVTPVARPDEEMRKDILMALMQDSATESYQVAVSVQGAVATLTGGVGSNPEKQLAGRIAKGVRGIKEVRNDVKVNYLTKRTDAEIASDVRLLLQWDIWINGDQVRADVQNGKVTLTGTIGSALAKSRAFDDGWVNGVTAVDNSGIVVEPGTSAEARKKLKYVVKSDTEVKQAVEAAFRLDPRVSSFSPEVTVEGGVVRLGGTVGNLKARASAEQDAKNTVSVWRVDNFLKVRPKGRTSDAEMTQQLKASLVWDSLLGGTLIDATVRNRVAYLTGSVESSYQKAEAQDVASRIKGVGSVQNNLKAEPDVAILSYDWPYTTFYDYPYNYDWPYYNQSPYYISKAYAPQPYLSDEQIKKNIGDSFFWSPFVDRDDIKVAVAGGVATLTGTVGTWVGWREADKDALRSGATEVVNRVTVRKGAWSWL